MKKKNSPVKKKLSPRQKSASTSRSKKPASIKPKLTKTLEAEILNVYNAGWEAYLKGDLKTHGFHLSNNFKIIGSSEAEQFNSKKLWLAYCKKTIKQFAGVIQLKNRKINLVPAGEDVMVVENADIYVLIDKKWSFYSRIRITALLQKEKTGWKYIHQHGSLPDARASEGEVIATAQIKKENLLLKEAVKRRTIELETKNQELEIEASLERVRTVAMAMRKPEDMLQICKSLYTELQKLGFSELRNSMINVYDDVNASFLNYDFAGETGSSTTFFKNDSHPVIENFIKQIRKTRDAFAPVSLSGTKLRDFIRFRELNGEKTDLKLRKASAIHYYFYSIGNGSIGISTLKTIPEAQVQTLKRFRNVFEIAYQRYRDISLAEEQAREAQIELALERVRARTMAMQKSEELAAVSEVLRKEMGALGVEELETSSIYIVNENETTECWYAIKDVRGKNKKLVTDHMTLRLDETWVGRQMKKFFYSKETRVSIVMKGENRKQWINYCAGKSSVLKGYYGGEIPARTYHLLKFSNGFMGAASPGEISAESWDLLQRAIAVFSFAYKRFSDLQKAEAQTREAKIEAALERIRARALAMHRSDEFTEVAKVMREQMGYLGQPELETSAVHLYEEDANNIFSWRAFRLSSDLKSNITFGFFKIPKNSCTIAKTFVQKFKSKATDYTIEVSGAEQAEWYKILFKLAPEVHAAMRKSGTTKEKRYYHFSKFTGGALLMVTSKAPANDAIELQKRSAQVFDLAYRRFKDLQQAEAQARESQIQLALERVRARTMAMQNSNELPVAANLLFQQMQELGMPAWSAGYCIWDEDLPTGKANKQGITLWMSSEGVMQPSFHAPLTEDPSFIHMREAFERNQDFHVEEVGGKELVKHYKYMRTLPVVGKVLDSIIEAGHPLPVFQIFHCVYFSQGFLLFITYEPVPEAHDVFKRFGRVFDQTYTRFLDLQKAEAQAREAQIEAALERVRSRSMAMHKSDELLEAGEILFSEMQKLDIESLTAGFVLMDKEEKNGLNYTPDPSTKKIMSLPVIIPHNETTHMQRVVENWKKGITHYVVEMDEKETIQHQTFIAQRSTNFTLNAEQLIAISPARLFLHNFYYKEGYLLIVGGTRLSADQIDIMLRFAKVFQQTYTRFLDLQKAEAQAREAQIEGSLERVRAKTMAMHNSEDVSTAIATLFTELDRQSIENVRCGIAIIDINKTMEVWSVTNAEESKMVKAAGTLDMNAHKLWQLMYDDWRNKNGFLYYHLSGKEKQEYINILNTAPYLSQPLLELPDMHCQIYFFNEGAIWAYSLQPHTEQQRQVMNRFTNVFSQTYLRYRDLQKAEAQAREATIEASLERVRSKTMAMHNSADVGESVAALFDELVKLGVTTNRCGILIHSESEFSEVWTAKSTPNEKATLVIGKLEINMHPMLVGEQTSWLNKEPFFSYELTGQDMINYYQAINNSKYYPTQFNLEALPAKEIHSDFHFSEGAVFAFTNEALPAEWATIFKRFTSVFGQTYRRYLDLQKAEAQAREAQIEAALERVRSRSLAMHKSDELPEVIQLVFEQLRQLNFNIDSAQFDLNFRESDDINLWTAVPGQPYPTQQHIPYFNNAVFNSVKHAKEAGLNLSVHNFTFEEKNEFFNYFFKYTSVSEERRKHVLSSPGWARSVVYLDRIYLGIQNYLGTPYTEAEHTILGRFAKVFEQAYTRFLDLQKAEASARESTIEAALEKVRGKAMAMHSSNDLLTTAGVVFTELKRLGINSFRGGVALIDKESRLAKMYSATSSDQGETLSLNGTIVLDGHPVLSEIGDCMIGQLDYFPALKGEHLESYIKHVSAAFNSPLIKSKYDEWYGCFLPYSEGAFYVWSDKPYTEDEIKVLKRFRAIVDLTFRRYLELQRAEVNALEALRSASLDRVRAEIASMRTKQDLERITPLIWKELTTLGIPFVRCGVFIMDDDKQTTHTFLSTPDGQAIAAFELPYDSTANLGEAVTAWRDHKKYVTHWIGKDFSVLADTIVQQGVIATREKYLNTVPKEGIYLHFLPFLQGMLYVGNTEELRSAQLDLIQSVANSFSTAYARYEDFNIIESAKAQVEKTLADLKQTQAQLVQSEKMASLGELTAGIAHEIQNPLNFVNNFSEVSNELIKEIQDIRHKTQDQGNKTEEDEILNDIASNLEKINHHGKRAADIVKGMLQHSRSSGGVKEATNINALADEYLRLAYHGLRAKDKSFNATLKTDFDESIGSINIIPQDIGRVILNLITNAFYVVNEKSKQGITGYEPTVSVNTKKEGNNVLISVKDNGNGIPKKILDKIFQPFFTTKPTGQGTGLGLSLSYDIVKAHGGELKVETLYAEEAAQAGKEGAGSVFIIILSSVVL